MRRITLRRIPFLVAGLAAALLLTGSAFAVQPGAIPQPVEPGPFTVDGLCAFPVTLTFSGKGGEVDLPGGRTLFTSPGLFGTFTNADDPSKSVTLNISGTAERDASDVTIFQGRSVLATHEGLVLIVGTFRGTHDADHYDIIVSGQGTQTPVCPMIS